jgi:hypothetical protein
MHRLAVPGLLLLAACGNALGPDRGDPASFLLARPAQFLCRGWSPVQPAEPLGLFDLYFGIDGSPPSEAAVRKVVRYGGTVVRTFQVNGLRAIISPEAVTRLAPPYAASAASADRIEHHALVMFHVTGKGGLIIRNGGRVTWTYSDLRSFSAIVPDSAVALIRRDPDYRTLELPLPWC